LRLQENPCSFRCAQIEFHKNSSALHERFPETKLRFDAEEYIPYIHAGMGDSTTALKLYEKLLLDYPDLEKKEKEWIEKQINKLKE